MKTIEQKFITRLGLFLYIYGIIAAAAWLTRGCITEDFFPCNSTWGKIFIISMASCIFGFAFCKLIYDALPNETPAQTDTNFYILIEKKRQRRITGPYKRDIVHNKLQEFLAEVNNERNLPSNEKTKFYILESSRE